MNIGDKLRLIVISGAWALWGLVCLFWVVDPLDGFSFFFGGMFHLAFYGVTVAILWAGGIWFLDEGADELGEMWMERVGRKNREKSDV